MKRILFSLLFLFPLSVQADMVIEHADANNPADEGWVLMNGVPGEPNADNTAWQLKTSGYARWGPAVPLTAADFDGDWLMEAEMKYNEGPLAEQRCTIFDGTRGKGFSFTWDENSAYYYQAELGDTPIPGSDPSEFHVYGFRYNANEDILDVSMDGELVAVLDNTQQNSVAPGNYLFYWGDNSSGAFSDSEWAYIVFDNDPPPTSVIPEPSSFVMLFSLLTVTAWCWRRKWKNSNG